MMIHPLPHGRNIQNLPTSGNKGLYFNKFFDQWEKISHNNGESTLEVKKTTKEFPDGGKQAWLKKFEGQSADVSEAANRIEDLAVALGGKTQKLTTTGPFVTGMGLSNPIENGFLWHHTLGVPYLPGSSIKGMIRAWAEEWEGVGSVVIGRLFGRDDKADGGSAAGNIIVFDALPVDTLTLYAEVITPHTGDWRITDTPENSPPADWVSPVPIPFLAVKEGAEFQFALAPRKAAEENDLEDAFIYLHEALEWIGAGAKTAVGFGRFLTNEKIAEQREKANRAQQKIVEEQKEAERNWIPSVGEVVHWTGVEDVRVTSIDGKIALVEFLDNDDSDKVPLTALRKK